MKWLISRRGEVNADVIRLKSVTANPYTPPAITPDVSQIPGGTWKSMLRLGALAYALFYAVLCLASLVEDVTSAASIFWIGLNIFMDTLTLIGIFALAVPLSRRSWMSSIWHAFPFVLTFSLFLTAAWEIVAYVPPLTPIEISMMIPVVILIVAPAIVMNFMLRSRLNATQAV